MIDILGPVIAVAHGGCDECDPNDDRGDDLHVFQLGSFKLRLCGLKSLSGGGEDGSLTALATCSTCRLKK